MAGDCDYEESEPNDTAEQVNDLGDITSGFCVTGSVTCGGGDYADLDTLVFTAQTSATVSWSLEWDGANTDLDGYVIDNADPENPLHNYEEGTAFESGSFAIVTGGVYMLQVGCWEGEESNWMATFDF